MCLLWFKKKVEKFKKLPANLIALHIAAKGLVGIGVGMLLAGYLPNRNWVLIGWFLVILGCLLALPTMYMIYKKK